MTNENTKRIKRLLLDIYAACIGVCLLIITIFWMEQLTPDFLAFLQNFFIEFDFLAAFRGGNALDPTNWIN